MYDELTEVDIRKMQEELDRRIRELRPAGLPAQTARQAALFDAFLHGSKLPDRQRQELLPQRALIVTLYRMIQKGSPERRNWPSWARSARWYALSSISIS